MVAGAARQQAEAEAASAEGRSQLAERRRLCDERGAEVDSEAAALEAQVAEASAPVALLRERRALEHAALVERVADLRQPRTFATGPRDDVLGLLRSGFPGHCRMHRC